MLTSLLSFFTSLLVVAFCIPPLIKVAFKKRLFDAPIEERKIHKKIIPNLGGLVVFTGLLFSLSLYTVAGQIPFANQLLAAGIILFIIGLKDDLIGVDPMKKFVAQFGAAFIITVLGDVRIADLQGVLGVHTLAYPFSIALSVFFIVGLVNAFNLIDGIDGLAGSLGVIMSLTFAYLFYKAGDIGWVILSMALAGSLIGFLVHNISPARIFMGDSGSLMIGFISAVAAIHLLNTVSLGPIDLGFVSVTSAPALIVAILIIPLFDTLRVFSMRLLKGQSPFVADKNHLHHRLLFVGLNHLQATAVLAGVNILCIVSALYLQPIGNNQLIGTLILFLLLLNTGFTFYIMSLRPAVKKEVIPVKLAGALPEGEAVVDKDFAESILEKISKEEN